MKRGVFLCFVSCVFAGGGLAKVGFSKDEPAKVGHANVVPTKVGFAKEGLSKVGFAKARLTQVRLINAPERGVELLPKKDLEVFFNTQAIKVHNRDNIALGKKCTSRCWESTLSRQTPSRQNTNATTLFDPHTKEKQLLVFVSFSLGNEILRALFDEVEKRGGRMILRGLKENSFVKTQQAIQALGINVDIDPPLFERFKIMCVPTFVVFVGDKADRVSGTMSLRAALEMLKEEGDV